MAALEEGFQEAEELQEVGNMKDATKLFSTEDLNRLKDQITKLEKGTDAEVVCAVATESGRYDRAECLCGLTFGLLALITGNKYAAAGTWDASGSISVGAQVILMIGGFVAGALLASYWHPLRKLFVRNADMVAEVNRCAHYVFSKKGIGSTKHQGGVLIYLSLFEHRLEIQCDQAVASKLKPDDLESIRDAVLKSVAIGEFTEGLLAGMKESETLLSKALPKSATGTSSLSNEPLLFHPRP